MTLVVPESVVVQAQNVVYGIAVGAGRDSGWRIVGSSILPLSPSLEEAIVARTHVGLKFDEHFRGGAGYFGKIDDGGKRWALLCSYEGSIVPEATGHHFVQRNVMLVPFDVFVRDAEARALDLMTSAHPSSSFTDVGAVTRLHPAHLLLQDGDTKPLISDDVLRLLLQSLLQEQPTIIVWPEPDLAALRSLLGYFPPTIRAFVTWCTCVTDVATAKFARLKIVREVEYEPNATILRFDRRDFVQKRFNEDIARKLVDGLITAASGGFLSALHDGIEDALADLAAYEMILAVADTALDRFFRHRKIVSSPREAQWETRYEHADDLKRDSSHMAAKERLWLLTDTMKAIHPESTDDRANLAELRRRAATSFAPDDFTKAGEEVAKLVKDGDIRRIAAFLVTFESLGKDEDTIRAAFFVALPGALAEARRTWQFVKELASGIPGTLPSSFLNHALAHWQFVPDPQWKDVRDLFGRIKNVDVDVIAANARLRAQIEREPSGRIAYALARARREGQRLQQLPSEMREADSAAIVPVLVDGVTDWLEWSTPLLLRAVGLVMRKDQAALRGFDEALARRVIDALGLVDDKDGKSLTKEEYAAADAAAREIVKHHQHLIPALEVSDARREIAVAEANLRKHIYTVVGAIQNKTCEIDGVLPSDGSSPMLWWSVMAAWYEREDFDATRVLELLMRSSQVYALRGARHLMAVAFIAPRFERREAETVAACAAVLGDQPYQGELRVDRGVRLESEKSLDVALAAISVFRGVKASQLARPALEDSLPPSPRLGVWSAILERLASRLGSMAAVGPVREVEQSVDQAEVSDLQRLKTNIDYLLEAVTKGRSLRGTDLSRALERGSREVESLLEEAKFRKS